jgi:hypothetical protein
MSLRNDQIQHVRAEILAICGAEKYNTLVRQHSEAGERGKLRFWQIELFENLIQQSSIPIDAMELYLQAFRGAEPVEVPEKPFVYPDAPVDALKFAVSRSDLPKIQECFRLQPDAVEQLESEKLPTWIMCEAGKHASPETVRLLVGHGCDLNQSDSNAFTGLCWAVSFDRHDVAKIFLELGADANKGLPLFCISSASDPVSMAKLLIEYGADPHQQMMTSGNPVDLLSRSLERGHNELTDYFRSLGVQSQKQKLRRGSNLRLSLGKILDYFQKHFGEVAEGSIEYIVSSVDQSPIAVHCIPSDRKLERSILFSVGLSELTHDRVELMLGLPLDWPTLATAINSETSDWPIQWMFRIATQLIENGGTENQDWIVLANESPPMRLANGVPFTCWALCGGKEPFVTDRKGDHVRILEMYPLYSEEHELEMRAGHIELLTRWAQLGVPEYIDLTRTNAGI